MKIISVILLAIFVISILVGDIDLASFLIATVSLVVAVGFWKAEDKMNKVERVYEEVYKLKNDMGKNQQNEE